MTFVNGIFYVRDKVTKKQQSTITTGVSILPKEELKRMAQSTQENGAVNKEKGQNEEPSRFVIKLR